jgi:hypothetical protein
MSAEEKKSPEAIGTVIAVLPEERYQTQKGEGVKRVFVIETNGEYPKKIAFEIKSDKVKTPSLGSVCTVKYEPVSREWQGKYFTNLIAWNVWAANSNSAPTQSTPSAPLERPLAKGEPSFSEVEDDGNDSLPF